ncbi:50S ribosomal protein L1 [Candidatus Poribacteria bacterium]|nr:50S ribosomal protein L1 [Candidatus Poribacteria bacterium]
MKRSKRYNEARKLVKRDVTYSLDEAVRLVRSMPKTKFNETVDLAARLGVDPRQPEQAIRGTVDLPHGTGKSMRVIAFAQGAQQREALDAGATAAGGEDLVERIQGGWLDFDAAVATPDMMPVISRTLGRVLGPRGLMPNPRTGTIAPELGPVVRAIQGGRIDYRVDRTTAIVHAPVGKTSFTEDQLRENVQTVIDALVRAKPATAKGRYIRSLALSPTMGPGVRLDVSGLS